MRPPILLILLVAAATSAGQVNSRLIGTSTRSAASVGQPLVRTDSVFYTYGGSRGGDLTSADLPFDRSYHWALVNDQLELQDGRSRLFNAQDQKLVDSSLVLNVPNPFVTLYQRFTYNAEGRVATENWFQGTDSIYYVSNQYTVTGKLAQRFVSQPFDGSWYNTTTVNTYNAMDSLTDKVVTSDFLSYSFHWDYSPEGWLMHYEELTPSGFLMLDHTYHPNGKIRSTCVNGNVNGPQVDSTDYAWNAGFDTVWVSGYNLMISDTLPNSRRRVAYDAQEREIEVIMYGFDGSMFVPATRISTLRNSNGQSVVDSLFYWDVSAFVHLSNEEFQYDAEGRKVERLALTRVGPDMVPALRQRWTYNGYGQLTGQFNDDTLSGAWVTTADSRWYYEDFVLEMIEAENGDALMMFPVPTADHVTFMLGPGTAPRGAVRLLDMAGREVLVSVSVQGDRVSMDVSGVPPGTYLAQWRSDRTVRRGKVVVTGRR